VFFIQKLVNNNLFKNNHTIILWNVLQFLDFKNSSGFLFNSISRRIFASQLGLNFRVGLIRKSSSKITLGLIIGETRYSASERKYTAAGGDIQVPWRKSEQRDW